MKIKIKSILALLLGILVFGTIFCNSQVKATEITEEQAQEIFDLIPTEFSVNFKEVEFEKANKYIEEHIYKILEENNIDISDLEIYVYNYGYTVESLYHGAIYLYGKEYYIGSKEININYNNSDKRNIEDENSVKKIKFTSPRYYEVGLDMIPLKDNASTEEWESHHHSFFDIIGEYYTKQANDNTITVKATAGAGGSDGSLNNWTWEGGTYILIFKNDILYDVRMMGQEFSVPVINVPSNITDDELNNYIISTIEKYNDEIANDITAIIKGAHIVVDSRSNPYEIDIPNGYTIEANNREISYIIVNKEVTNIDTKTNIKLETTSDIVPEGTALVVNKVTTGESYNTVIEDLGSDIIKCEIYDISLINNNAKIQPNGKVKISIPIPEGFEKDKLIVYSIKDNEKTKYNVTVEKIDGKDYATFETDHFSIYALATEKTNNELQFKDVPKNSWYYSGIEFTYKNGMFKGYSETEFAPMDKVTRGQLVTVLYRFEKEPDVSKIANKFTDVEKGVYYTNAVKWAAEIGIVKGYGGTTKFGPNDPILRQDLAIVLQKYAQYKGKDYTSSKDISYFVDYNKVKGGYAENAVKWAVANGIISGNALSNGKKAISPFDNATRAEIAAMLMRFIQNFNL